MGAEVLATVARGGIVESVHLGHIIVIDGDRKTVFAAGDASTVTFFRSASKIFQLIPCITSGAADAFGFTPEEIALAAASHSGEPLHVEIAAQMLAKAGFAEGDLRCGVHLPFDQREANKLIRAGVEPSQLHNNCSGKHAAMLALAKHIGAETADYESVDNRVQQRILRCVAEFTEIAESEIGVGTDGCSAPNFAVPLSAMAKSYVNLLGSDKLHPSSRSAAARVLQAAIANPYLIGGNDRLDTQIMQAANGVFSKVGADGVWTCCVLPSQRYPTGLGIALKIADGDDYISRPVVAVSILRRLNILGPTDLANISPMPVKNRRGDVVGRVEAVGF